MISTTPRFTRAAVALLVLTGSLAVCGAGEELQSVAAATISPDGTAVAVADPVRKRTVIYRRGAKDDLQKLWTVERWFPKVWVWNGGAMLAGDYGSLVDSASGSEVVIEVLEPGEMIASVTVGEILEDLANLEQRGSRYYWGTCHGFDQTGAVVVQSVENAWIAFEVDVPPPPDGPSQDEIAAALDAVEGEGGPKWWAEVDYGRGLGEMIREAGLDEVDSNITAAHFPEAGSGSARVVFDLVKLGRAVNGEQATQALEKLGFRPATLRELLAFAARYPAEVPRRNTIVALGATWDAGRGNIFCARVEGSSSYHTRYLKIQSMRDNWADATNFLVVVEEP